MTHISSIFQRIIVLIEFRKISQDHHNYDLTAVEGRRPIRPLSVQIGWIITYFNSDGILRSLALLKPQALELFL